MREIFKRTKGKDFYRDQLEYLEYDPNMFMKKYKYHKLIDEDIETDDEIGFRIVKKCS